MSKHMFSEASHLSDAVLIVEGKKLHVSKTVLSLVSPVFDRMFHGDFAEAKNSEITLPDKQYDHVVEFLSCIYPSSNITVTKDNMDVIMPLADEYQVASIKDTCDTLIESMFSMEEKPTTSELVHFMYFAGQNGLPKSLNKCIEVASAKCYSDLQYTKMYEQVDQATKYKVASRRIQRYEEGCRILRRRLEDKCRRCRSNRNNDDETCSCTVQRLKDVSKQLSNFHIERDHSSGVILWQPNLKT